MSSGPSPGEPVTGPGGAAAPGGAAGPGDAVPQGDAAAPGDPEILVRVEDGVATITLNRPATLNALTIPMKEHLLAAFEATGRDAEVRAVVLTGAGRAFCAGQDLKERLAPDPPSFDEELRLRYNPIVRAIRDLPQPVVAAVNGVAAGAGASLAFACDLRIAAEGASFVLAFGRIGLVPDTGATWTLPRLVGTARAAEIALLGDAVDAATALQIGLVSRVVPAGALEAEAAAMAGRLAGLAPGAAAATKRLLAGAFDVGLDEALEGEAAAQAAAGADPDHAEGLAAFVEKRPPRFGGG
ncbi:MAG: enoyl-CoA hydratase-related protein [Chloroflexi bacterium]|nr:enoyl-CoA hydratase-related protein [Chloroflexota bacterium]